MCYGTVCVLVARACKSVGIDNTLPPGKKMHCEHCMIINLTTLRLHLLDLYVLKFCVMSAA